jgi:hypothetical protein
MATTTILVDERIYRYSPDDDEPWPLATWAIVTARAIDEITGAPPDAAVSVRVAEPVLVPQAGPDGLIGVLVSPFARYPVAFAPGFSINLTLEAARYLPRTFTVPIARSLVAPALAGDAVIALDARVGMLPGQRWTLGDPTTLQETVTIAALGPGPDQLTLAAPLGVGFAASTPLLPDRLTPVVLGNVELHRAPVSVRGRVMVWDPVAVAFQPSAGASVEVPWTWRKQSEVTQETSKQATRLVSLAPGLYRDRLAATATLQPIATATMPGDDKRLLAATLPGDVELDLSNATALATNPLLSVDRESPDVAESVRVASFVLSGVVEERARAALEHPLRLGHRRGVTVEHLGTTDVLTPKAFDADGAIGDPVAFLTDVAFGGVPEVVRISGGDPAEYQRVRLFSTTTDADGYFALPPISRVAKLRITVTPAATPPQEVDLQPDYRSHEQWLDVRFS